MSIPQTLWNQRIPLLVTHTSAPTAVLPIAVPRFSYLALLLPRLSAYFDLPCSSFHHEDVLLRNLAVGLLVDLYQPSMPWKLTVGDDLGWDIGDTFLNCVKEADFVRNGNANQIMKMSRADTTALWDAVRDNDFATYSRIQTRLLNAPTALKHVPVRVYIPSQSSTTSTAPISPGGGGTGAGAGGGETVAESGAFKIAQFLVPAMVAGTGGPVSRHTKKPQTLGMALRTLMPDLFPSSRDPLLANIVMHGAPVPFHAPLAELMKEAAYPDGWLSLVVVLL